MGNCLTQFILYQHSTAGMWPLPNFFAAHGY